MSHLNLNRITVIFLVSKSLSISVDCPDLLTMASGLGIQSKQPALWLALQSDCCIAAGILCSSQRVTRIKWDNMGLDGVINGNAIPSTVTILDISHNQLSGSIPVLLPNGLTSLNLKSNDLSGSIPTILPSGMTYLELSYNALTGVIPLSLPSGLTALYLSGNQLTGSIPSNLPNTLIYLRLDINKLSGDLPPLPVTLQVVYLGYFGTPTNHFSGTLRLNAPTQIYINDNWINNIIVQDSAQIGSSFCDLSNNPLLGNPIIATLPMCTKNGIYSANMLPITYSTIKTTTSSIKTTPTTTSLATKASSKDSLTGSTSRMSTILVSTTTTKLTSTTTIGILAGKSLISSSSPLKFSTARIAVESLEVIYFTTDEIQSFATETEARLSIATDLPFLSTPSNISLKAQKTKNAISTKQIFGTFDQNITTITITITMVIHILLNGMILIVVLMNAPFFRELKKRKVDKKETNSSIEL